METNEIFREQVFEIINNQLKDKKPKETKETLDRLRKEGFSTLQAKQLIGQCVVVELFTILKHKQPYNNERYIRNLLALPEEPFE